MTLRPASRARLAPGPLRPIAAAAVLVSAGAFIAATTGPATATGTRSAPPERFARCTPPGPGDEDPYVQDLAAESHRKEYGGTKAQALRWMQVQDVGTQILEKMRASPARKDFMSMVYDNDDLKVRVYVRNRSHDAAIRHCARQMGINRYVTIGIHRWSDGDRSRAVRQLIQAVEPLFQAGLVGTDTGTEGGDFFYVDVYAPATDEQYTEVEAAAEKTGVAYKMRRHAEEQPVAELS